MTERVVNLLGYQLTWFVTVSSVAHDRPLLGILTALLFCICQLAASRWPLLDLKLIAGATLMGAALDGFLARSGLVHYAATAPALPILGCPVWILGLWMAFATTITRSLGWLRGRAWAAAVFGAVGGPLAYWAAARGWGAVNLADGGWKTLLALGIGWGLALVMLLALSDRSATAVSANAAVEEADFP